MFTLKEMRYLIHGGRVSHLEGLMAQVLNVKPIIAVEHEKGTYVTAGKLINFKRALAQIVEINYEKFKNEKVRAQIVHGINPEGVEYLKEKLQENETSFLKKCCRSVRFGSTRADFDTG